ncbi:T6SS phospholipase effector Tle1-like catalytic domain-containing protein [Ectopseudomonas khazarica]|uniref:T6SS phospholipase effector Tle1-like catalytic domain-containing protein n=1 Tax=Ectopseudomonas khazarica TaxID=2502979 RepID=UPI0037C52A5D
MSKTLSPPPASVLIARPFERTGLPIDSSEVARNIRSQNRDEKKAWGKTVDAAAKQGDEAPEPCCKALHISLCFDGTNNHEPSDSIADPICTSNVARLYHASIEKTEKGFFRYYSPGVGTVFEEIKEYLPSQAGLIGASGGEDRINWGLTRLIAALKETLKEAGQEPLSIAQTQALVEAMATNWAASVLSGGILENGAHKRKAAMQPYEDELANLLEQRRNSGEKPEILALRLYVYGFSRGAAQARAFANWLMELTRQQKGETSEYRFAGLPISIEFLGLFDTVAAVGLADSAPFAAGHMDWASGTMRLPDESQVQACMPTGLPEDCHFLKRCVHLVSAHEQRASFPLDSIRRREKNADGKRDETKASAYRKDSWEYVYPGMHSDVGGGYPPGDQGKARGGQGELLSQIPLHHMYRSAFAAGAPLQIPELLLEENESWRKMGESTLEEFDFTPQLVSRFNAWQKQAKAGSLENVIKREQALITAWRIDRYAGGIDKQGFYSHVKGQDMTEEQQDALKRLHAQKLAENSAAAQGKEPPVLSAKEQQQREADLELVGGSEAYARINTNKAFEPALDDRQLRRAAAEFKRDYDRSWGVDEDTFSVGGIINMLLGGTVYLINEEDEAQEYAELYQNGTQRHGELFTKSGVIVSGEQDLVALFDEQVHDSRAWFMNSSGFGEREPFTDYFRYRLVHFDNESNKSLSVLATAGRVVGVGIALASVGLSIKKRNPRYLLGLFLPSLATPVLTGRPGLPAFPEISAFDPLTGIALPMMQGVEAVRAFTQKPGDVVAMLNAMPLPVPLTEQTATTPELQAVFKAAEAVKTVKAANDSGDMSGLLGQAMDMVGKSDPKPGLQSPGWLDQAKGMAKDLTG